MLFRRLLPVFSLFIGIGLVWLLLPSNVMAMGKKQKDKVGATTPTTSRPPQQTKKPPKVPKLDEGDEVTGMVFISNLAGSFNNPGVRLIARIGYQWRLFKPPSESLALSNNYIRLNGIIGITPIGVEVGPNISIQPAAFIRVGVNYGFRAYLPVLVVGTLFKDAAAIDNRFKGTVDFLDGESRISDQNKETIRRNNGERVGVHAHVVRVHWRTQLRFFNIIAQFTGAMQFWFTQYEDADNAEYWYEGANDIIAAKTDQIFSCLGVIGYEWKMLRFLAATTYQYAIQSKEEIWSLGPAVQWSITEKWGPFHKPNILFVVRWWLRHRFRSGPIPNAAFILQSNLDFSP